MTHYEMVELLREKANVSYEEAKNALEKSDWDLLDAIVLLEREGKTPKTTSESTTRQEEAEQKKEEPRKSEFRSNACRLGDWIRHLIVIGNRNSFVVTRGKEESREILQLSVTAFVLLLACSWPLTVCLLLIGLFTGCRYSFRGPQLGTDTVNGVMDKVNGAVDRMQAEFTEKKEEQE